MNGPSGESVIRGITKTVDRQTAPNNGDPKTRAILVLPDSEVAIRKGYQG